jgi:hypothetical protein
MRLSSKYGLRGDDAKQPGPNQVGGERLTALTADNSSLSVQGERVGGEAAGMLALDFPFDVTTKPNNKMPHPFVTVLMH